MKKSSLLGALAAAALICAGVTANAQAVSDIFYNAPARPLPASACGQGATAKASQGLSGTPLLSIQNAGDCAGGSITTESGRPLAQLSSTQGSGNASLGGLALDQNNTVSVDVNNGNQVVLIIRVHFPQVTPPPPPPPPSGATMDIFYGSPARAMPLGACGGGTARAFQGLSGTPVVSVQNAGNCAGGSITTESGRPLIQLSNTQGSANASLGGLALDSNNTVTVNVTNGNQVVLTIRVHFPQ